MGWTSTWVNFSSRDSTRIKDFLADEWNSGGIFSVVDYSKKGNTVYMAVKKLDTEEIFAVVTLISFSGGEFYWKTMDESMGPVEAECPQRILKRLTPTDYEFAQDWRDRCWQYHKTNKIRSQKYKHGDILEFPREISFMNGFNGKVFILVKEGRSTYFAPFKGQNDMSQVYAQYRITRWKNSDPKIIGQVGDYQKLKVDETTLVSLLPERVKEEIIKDLAYAGVKKSNFNNTRLCDLKEMINIESYIS